MTWVSAAEILNSATTRRANLTFIRGVISACWHGPLRRDAGKVGFEIYAELRPNHCHRMPRRRLLSVE
jgi:hypothetical protein